MHRVFEERSPEFVVNFAAESHVDRSIDGPRAFVETNLGGTFELLEASRALLRRAPGLGAGFRFLHVSTDEVYGTLDATGRFSETSPYAPNSPYAATKAGADHLVQAYFETYQLPVLITNCSNNYGPYQYPEKLIPLMVLNALEGKPLPIYGDGRNVRDWIYVEDHCAGVLRALERGRPGEKYNLGGSAERDNLTIIDTLCSILETLAPANANPALRERGIADYAHLKTFVADRPGHDRRYAIDASKARAELAWEPRQTLDSGLERTVAWYLKNRAWCETVQKGRYDRQRLGLTAGEGST
jgi:dTDP-glucose 4,6-dehydratase